MKLLLDENLPRRLKEDFANHEIYTVRDMGWNGINNGQLLALLVENGFQVLLTFDKNLQHQQNVRKYSISVFVLSAPTNTYPELKKLIPQIKETLLRNPLPKGPTIIS